MQRAQSPASVRSQDTVGSKPATTPGHKAAYRLFPSVEPTPPASPVSLQRAVLTRVESQRRRSSSLDDTARTSAVAHYASRLSQLATRRGPKTSLSELKPMSTVQEQPLDSPTVLSPYTPKTVTTSVSEEGGHGRSSSAPGDCLRDNEQDLSAGQPAAWTSRHAAASALSLHGLGLTLAPAEKEVRPTTRKGPKRKPDLRVHTGREEKSLPGPPPPPPKSPRHHSRGSSAHSRTSSAHSRISSNGGGPIVVAQTIACTTVKPTFVNHRTGSNTSVQTPPTTYETRELYFSSDTDTQARNVMGAPNAEPRRVKKMLLRKPVPSPPVNPAETLPISPLLPPSSKFSTNSPTFDSHAEGEKTPRAMPPQQERPKTSHTETNTKMPDDTGLKPSTDEIDDVPPPTPRKDSFHLPKASVETNTAHSRHDSDSHDHLVPLPNPLKAHPLDTEHATTMLHAPSRMPLPRPESPKPPPKDASARESKLPAQETLSTRAVTPEPSLKPDFDRPTPELPFRSSTPDPSGRFDNVLDPLQTLKDLAKQTEALHARYARLRSDRQKLSTSVVTSLRERKAGPDYCNTLLDQHLCLAAINSSMDICFAKLKSLECRKEEAMTNLLAQRDAKHKADKKKKPISVSSTNSLQLAGSGRSTPEPMTAERDRRARSGSKLRKDSARLDETAKPTSPTIPNAGSTSDDSEKRNTMIKSPPSNPPPQPPPQATEPEDYPPTDAEDEAIVQPKKIRIKGAKAAKILGLMKEAAETRPGSPGITLPDQLLERKLTPPTTSTYRGGGGPTIEVHIPTSPFRLLPPPPRSPAPTVALPPPPPPAKDTEYTSHSSTNSSFGAGKKDRRSDSRASEATSSAESSPEEPEIETPKEENVEQVVALKGLNSARRELVQTVQVFVDDEILDYYHLHGEK